MKKLIAGILLSVASVATIVAFAASPLDIPKEIVEWSETNVMYVDVPGGMGSGFWVDNETFVTACHVVGQELLSWDTDPKTGELEITVDFEVQTEVQVSNNDLSVIMNLKVETCDQKTDIAVLSRQWFASDSEFTAAPSAYAHPNPEFGSVVYGPGFGMGENLHITWGHWQNEAVVADHDDVWLITAPTIYGDSGSPAIRLNDGVVEIVGIRQQGRAARDQFVSHLIMVSGAMTIHSQVEQWKESK